VAVVVVKVVATVQEGQEKVVGAEEMVGVVEVEVEHEEMVVNQVVLNREDMEE
jgi:hypothetical protein